MTFGNTITGNITDSTDTTVPWTISYSCPSTSTKLAVVSSTPLVSNNVNPFQTVLLGMFKVVYDVTSFVTLNVPQTGPSTVVTCYANGYSCDLRKHFTQSNNPSITTYRVYVVPSTFVKIDFTKVITLMFTAAPFGSITLDFASPFANATESALNMVVYPDPLTYSQVDYMYQKVDIFVNSTGQGLSYFISNITATNTIIKRVLGSPSTSILSYNYQMMSHGNGPSDIIGFTQIDSTPNALSTYQWTNGNHQIPSGSKIGLVLMDRQNLFVSMLTTMTMETFLGHSINALNQQHRKAIEYPFGFISNVDPKSPSFEAVFAMSEYRLPYSHIGITGFEFDNGINSTIFPNTTEIDLYAPTLINITFVPINMMEYLVQVEVEDVTSGFGYLVLEYTTQDKLTLSPADMVGGDIHHAYLAKIITIPWQSSNNAPAPNTIYIYDNAGNECSLPFIGSGVIYNPQLKSTADSPGLSITLADITSFTFEKTVMDVSSASMNNTLTFTTSKLINNWIPILVFGDDLSNPYYRARGHYDYATSSYIIPFTVPARTFTTTMKYYLESRPEFIDVALFNSKFPSTSSVQIISTYGDELPPMITKVVAVPSKDVVIDSVADTTDVGWDLTIEDQPNGFSYGSVNISNSLDGQLISINFTNNDVEAATGIYRLRIKVSKFQRVHSITIEDIMLVDTMNNVGRYARDPNGLDLMTAISPLAKVLGSPELNITLTNSEQELSPPQLLSMFVSRRDVDVGSNDRWVQVNLSVSDTISGYDLGHLPTVYFTSTYDEVVGYQAEFVSANANGSIVNFTVNCLLPYGFGSQAKIAYLSIYGLMNKARDLGGYSNKALSNHPNAYINFLNIQFTQTTPIIEKYLVTPGSLTIIGRNFGMNPGQVNGVLGFADVGNVTKSPSFHSGIMLIINTPSIKLDSSFSATINNNNIYSNTIYINADPTNNGNGNGNGNKTQPTITCPGTPVCFNRGSCSPTVGCICDPGWYGNDCTSTVTGSDPTYDGEKPMTSIVDGNTTVVSTINVVKLKEFDNAGNMVDQMDLIDWTLINETVNGKIYSVDTRGDAKMKVEIKWFDQDTDILFAGDTLHMKKSTLKYTISMSNYPFKSKLNILQVIMRASINSSNSNSCSTKRVGNIDGNGNDDGLYWMRLKINGVSLYAHFIQRALVDGRPHVISNALLDKSEQEASINNINNNQAQATIVAINVPHFDRDVILDPDFQLLLDVDKVSGDDNDAICSSKTKSLSTIAMIGIIVGVVEGEVD
ncbi:hypothetical protein SAMD00019534_052380 [Acytostelium subglobosum LB1]|uniref:hypothetical protein n=1 Tax=Acytostelium subglobosum LB1 TaxID=1410327 RepID=UPI000644E311|nr:hypothetical protein SAMD00019534_052380 [Acytostelium subglobosum LB1]GAM22063.1 hypothetical protein SAMD00019534_052380 [Acytostelium subglobosum LB1]|eukprot:XP_012755163.1 hypothetical protein SAMD00019534_052380 [Acytostelium subglobosum LB1]